MRRLRQVGIVIIAAFFGGCSDNDYNAARSANSGAGFGASANAVPVFVGQGPAPSASNLNIPYVTVTVCVPGTSNCANIDHVLLDTGSWGLRLMASALAMQGVTLADELDANGNPIGECTPFASGYSWGPVVIADVELGGEFAGAVPVQLIDDNASQSGTPLPASCSNDGAPMNSVASFSANGVLGVGVFKQDCGPRCEQVAANGVYFSCGADASGAGTTCRETALALAQQVTNPVSLFASDNNGVIVSLPPVPADGAASAAGQLIFGIGTKANNALAGAAVLSTDGSTGHIITMYGGRTLSSSVIDTGSNSIEFLDSTIAPCPGNPAPGFYCPAATLSLSATNEGYNGTLSTVNFTATNFTTLRQNNRNAFAFDNLASTASAETFDWGLPFFFGRNVYDAIESSSTPGGPGPYYAY